MMILQKIISFIFLRLGLMQFCHAANQFSSISIDGQNHRRVSDEGRISSFDVMNSSVQQLEFDTKNNLARSSSTINEVVDHHQTTPPEEPRERALQQQSSTTASPMAGSCVSSTMEPGKQLVKGSYLCYPPPSSSTTNNNQNNNSPQSSVRYEFGINSSSQIALYLHTPTTSTSTYQLLWTATPPTSLFSQSGIQYIRMQGALGSLAGYNPSRRKIYDSHDDGGRYSQFAIQNGVEDENVVREKESRSRLELTEDGVFILNEGGEVTFQIVVPTQLKQQQQQQQQQVVEGSSVQGFIWNDDTTKDGIFGAGDKAFVVGNGNSGVDVTLLECETNKVVKSVTSGNDGTFVIGGLIAGRYKVHVTPPGSTSSSGGVGGYEFVSQSVNEGNTAAVGQDSDVNQDGFSKCLVVNDTGVNGGKLTHLVYVGMIEKRIGISVGGKVFHDHNGDGLFSLGSTTSSSAVAVASVGNIVVDLYDCVNPDTWIAVTRTDASGNYKFIISDPSSSSTATTTTTDLALLLEQKGVTKFRAVFSGLPNGYTFSPKSMESDVITVDGKTSCYDVTSNNNDATTANIVWNAGIKPPQTGKPTMRPTMSRVVTDEEKLVTIGGYAFLDVDNNGIRSPNFEDEEVSIADISVRLFSGCNPSSSSNGGNNNDDDDDGTFFSAARTDAQGLYKFVNIPSGAYKMLATAPEGYEFSSTWTNNDVNTGVDSAFNPETGTTKCFFSLEDDDDDGKTDLSWGVGLRDTTPVIISGMVFDDVNNNGFFETGGELPMSDVSVGLFDCNGNIQMFDNTDANGMYGFSDLTAGSYLLKFSVPEGYQMSSTWTGMIDNEGKMIAPDADSHVNPETESSVCKTYKAGDEEYSLDAGMSSNAAAATTPATTPTADTNTATAKPTVKPTNNLKGDGTPCSGGRCNTEGMCRNKAGLCGIGLAFCNADSAWTKNCPEGSSSTVPNDSSSSLSWSLRPTPAPSPATISNDATTKPFCQDDGSVGEVSGANSEFSIIQFKYSIESDAFSSASTPTLIDDFEKELNRLVACEFIDNPCLKCNEATKTRALRSTKNSTMIGLSPFPIDEITLGQCSPPSSKCKVMKGVMTSFYPKGTSASLLVSEQTQLLDSIGTVINNEDWVGMKVSLDDTSSLPEEEETKPDDSPPSSEGLSGGAITGIMIAVLSVFAAVAVAVIRIRRIRDEEDEEYFKQLQEHMQDKSIPFGNADLISGDDEDDSDDSSYDSDEDSSSHPSRSAISGETFPTNIAQAMPQDIDDSESSSESGSSESEDDLEHDGGEEVEVQMNQEGIDQLKYSGGSDSAPSIYENYDRMDSEEILAAAEYDDDHRDQSHPYQIPSTRGVGDDFGADDATATSVNSADPPGQSYRDLPEDWEPALPPSTMDYVPGGERYPSGEAGFPVYDNDLSENESEQGSHRSGRSNNSYHSNRSHRSNRSNHSGSQRSRRSYHSHVSQGSRGSQGSHRSGRSNAGSHYSRHSNPDQQEVDGNNGNGGSYNNQSDHNDSYQSQHSYHSNHSGSGSDRSYHEEYDQYGTNEEPPFVIRRPDNPNSFQQPHPRYDDSQQYMMNEQEQAYAAANHQQQGRFNDENARYGSASSPPYGGGGAFYERGGGGEFDEASYHSFDPQPPQSHPYQPELLDDHVDDVSTFTSATRKVSNVSHQEEEEEHEEEEEYEGDDDEESISEIFKSLSAIQTKLASKGKPGGGKYDRSSSRSKKMGMSPSVASPPSQHRQQQGWDFEGIVEDVSVDGSQFPSMTNQYNKNRHPQQGQWMEPVDENEHGD